MYVTGTVPSSRTHIIIIGQTNQTPASRTNDHSGPISGQHPGLVTPVNVLSSHLPPCVSKVGTLLCLTFMGVLSHFDSLTKFVQSLQHYKFLVFVYLLE